MRKILFIITSLFAMLQISCVEKSGYYTESENRIIDLICDIASGRTQTKNEKSNFSEISIFKDGVVL